MKKQTLFVLLFALLTLNLGIAQTSNVVMNNYQKAVTILQKTIEQHGGKDKLKEPINFRLEGTKYFFGHYEVPEKTIGVLDTEKITFFPKLGISYLYSSLNYYGQRTKLLMNHGDSTYYWGYFSRDFSKGKLQERTQLYLSLPSQMLLMVDNNKKTLSFVGEDKAQNILSFNDDLGNLFNLCIDKKTNRLQKVSQMTYHKIYGDSFDEVMYEYTEGVAAQPSKFKRYEHGLLESDFVYKDFKTDPKVDTGFVEYVCTTCKIETIEKENNITIESAGKNLWLVALNHLDNKMLLAEYASYLMLFEAPTDAQTCREVIYLVQKKFPTKPIKYVAFSHHHPDHAGGFAAFVEANVQIITTKGNVPYFEKLLKTTHTLNPKNTIASSQMSIQTIAQKDSLTIKDAENQVIIYEGGENTDHVKEYLWFYFPLQKTLFVGDLVMFPQKGIREQTKRAYSVYKLIEDKKLDVEKIYTAWPLKEQKAFGSMEDLKASLVKNYPNIGSNK